MSKLILTEQEKLCILLSFIFSFLQRNDEDLEVGVWKIALALVPRLPHQ